MGEGIKRKRSSKTDTIVGFNYVQVPITLCVFIQTNKKQISNFIFDSPLGH